MKNKMRVLWLSAIACNGNTHSFLNYPFLEQFLDDFEFIYHPVIDSHYTLEDIVSKEIPCDILLIEGAISKEFQRADVSVVDNREIFQNSPKNSYSRNMCNFWRDF